MKKSVSFTTHLYNYICSLCDKNSVGSISIRKVLRHIVWQVFYLLKNRKLKRSINFCVSRKNSTPLPQLVCSHFSPKGYCWWSKGGGGWGEKESLPFRCHLPQDVTLFFPKPTPDQRHTPEWTWAWWGSSDLSNQLEINGFPLLPFSLSFSPYTLFFFLFSFFFCTVPKVVSYFLCQGHKKNIGFHKFYIIIYLPSF